MKSVKVIICSLLVIIVQRLGAQIQQDFYDINRVQEIRIRFYVSNWKHKLDSLFQSGDGKTRLDGEVTINGVKFTNVGIRYKGFSSWNASYLKNPFSIYLDHHVDNRNYQGFTTVKLSNVIHDPSFIREVLSYEIARKYMPASRANFAEVYINDTLIGLYTSVETVDRHFVKKHFGSDKNPFFKGNPANLEFPFGQNANLAYTHGTDTTGYMPYYECESGYGWQDLLNFIYILNNDTSHIAEVLNVDRALWMHAFNYALVNLDSYIGYSQNYYLYLDDNHRFNTIPWDLNMSFGSFRYTDGTAPWFTIPVSKIAQVDPLKHLTANTLSPRPLTRNLLSNKTYRKMFLAHMRTIVNENFRNNEYYSRALQIQSIIDSFVQRDTNKFYSYSDFLNNLYSTTGPSSYPYPGIKALVEARIAYLDTFPGFNGEPAISLVSHNPQIPARGENVCITAKVAGATHVMLYYRYKTNGVFGCTVMYDDGLHHDGNAGDSIYGCFVTAGGNMLQYYIWAENDLAGAFSPERAEKEYYQIQTQINPKDVVINEIGLHNSLFSDSGGELDSWIELFNNTDETLNLKNCFLTDDVASLNRWQFPDTLISAKSFLILWADNDTGQEGLHLNFELNRNQGKILLVENSRIIDSVSYYEQPPDKTFGRYPNGYGIFVSMNPSFAKTNLIGAIKNLDFKMYPNPSDGKLYIEFLNEYHNFSVNIYNSCGQRIMSREFDTAGKNYLSLERIDISGFSKGIYWVQLIHRDTEMVRKLMVY